MEDYFKKLTLKNSYLPSINISAPENRKVTKAIYHLLWQTIVRLKKEVRNLIDECDSYNYTEEDFYKIFPQKYMKDFARDGRLYILRHKYTEQFTDLRFAAIIYSATIIEGIITEYLLKKTPTKSQYAKLISNYSIVDKWKKCPKHFMSDYNLPDSLEKLLTKLNKQRKYIIHNEPFFEINSTVKHEGRLIENDDDNMTLELLSFMDLPIHLLRNLVNYDTSIIAIDLLDYFEFYNK